MFTDYANKYRFVFVPEGAQAAYRSREVIDFPVGTIIAKTFTIQADLRHASSTQNIIETRLLIRRKDDWIALPYIWNEAKTDEVLTVTGGAQNVSWIDQQGTPRSTNYVIPNTNKGVAPLLFHRPQPLSFNGAFTGFSLSSNIHQSKYAKQLKPFFTDYDALMIR